MRKGKHVVGQTVVTFEEGRKLDTVKDLLISDSNDSIVALLVDEGGLLSSSRVVPFEGVKSFGRDAVVLHSAEVITSASDHPEVKQILNRDEKLLGKRVLTDTGDQMGSISDMYFEDTNGRIQGFEVSGGVLGDIARGTSHLAVDEIERIGPDVIFVRPETGEGLEGQRGGLQGAFDKAGNRIGEAVDRAQQNIQAEIASGNPEGALVGRRAGTDVADDNGRIIVANGQRIRTEHVDWAKRTDNVQLLASAAAKGEASDMGRRAGASLDQAGDNIAEAWDRFTARISEMRDDHGKQVDEQQTRARLQQIADSVGRPVGKVILDRSDNVILDFGDIITHQAVQQAHDAGQLDTLLGSVYRAEFGLPLDDLRANERASATVKEASGGASVVEELEDKVARSEREKAEQKERERAEADAESRMREQEREARASEREQSEQQRQQELEEFRAEQQRQDAAGQEPLFETAPSERPAAPPNR
jgi:uncharacterized protein YrrD